MWILDRLLGFWPWYRRWRGGTWTRTEIDDDPVSGWGTGERRVEWKRE